MKIEKIIRKYFSKEQDVLCVYLFGSAAFGKEHRRSDVDIAVLFDKSTDRSLYFEKKLSIAADISRHFNRNVDVVILNEADTFLKFQILKSGVRIYERLDRQEHNFEAKAVLEYFDFLPIRRRMEKAMIDRIKGA